MPYLSPADRVALLGPLPAACVCGAVRVRHYCRSCDEFFYACACLDAIGPEAHHDGHRVYLWTPDRGVVALPSWDLP